MSNMENVHRTLINQVQNSMGSHNQFANGSLERSGFWCDWATFGHMGQ